MNTCKIIEDLLPLFEENLVQPETKEWMETHLTSCAHCRKLASIEIDVLPIVTKPEKSAKKMMHNAQIKLTVYQLLFVLLSFIFAINTSMLNESFAFILSYFVLGAVTFYFYRNVLLTLLLSFVPIFIWTIYATIDSFGSFAGWYNEQIQFHQSIIALFINLVVGGIWVALIHSVFTIFGIMVVKLFIQAFRKDESS